MSRNTFIPYVEAPEIDCLDALMSFDAATAEGHEIFARRFYRFELAGVPPIESEAGLANLTVVRRAGPGVRCRRFIHAPNWPSVPIYLPPDFFSWDGLEPL